MESETDFESDFSIVEFQKETNLKLKLSSLKRHKCPYKDCTSAFNRPWKLERHINTHTGNRPFKCDIPGCAKDYLNKSHLLRHKSQSHSDVKVMPVYISCPYPNCEKTFSNKWSLKKHCNIHKNGDLYKCKECNCTFKKHRQLKIHQYSHSGSKPFVCNSCDETFSCNLELKKHERKHKIYVCDHNGCNEEFNYYNALRAHAKKNHPNWLECDFCNKVYLNKWTLAEHILSHLPHSSRDVLVCPYEDCGRHYFHQRNLDHHINSYHCNINYQCSICNKTYANKNVLKKHQKLHLKSENIITQTKDKKSRKPRKDKGLPQKSKAALLSGIKLPNKVDKNLAQNKLTPEVIKCIENVTKILCSDN